VSVEDLLPPFSALTTDEEREKKAESLNPGTLYVIANPKSFESLPEYQSETWSNLNQNRVSPPAAVRWDEEYRKEIPTDWNDNTDAAGDPNTIILKRFEDASRRLQRRPSRTPPENPGTPSSSEAAIVPVPHIELLDHSSEIGSETRSMLDVARQGGKDSALLKHYRTAISPGMRLADKMGRDEDIFETHARVYPPLFHALMALSALSMSQRSGKNRTDSLEHYQQVIPALKEMVQNSSDSYSDGAFFTHFILLIYEVSNCIS
jgi:hypothetical protein